MHAQEGLGEKTWMNPEIQTTLLNKYPPTLIATILKALREQLKDNDQLNAVEEVAGPVPESQILKGGRFWDDVNGGCLPEDLVLAARREVIDWAHSSEGVYEIVPMQECKDAGMKPLDLIWWRQTSLWIRHARQFDRGCVQEKTRRRSKGRFKGLYPLLSCSLQCHLLKLSRCLSQP